MHLGMTKNKYQGYMKDLHTRIKKENNILTDDPQFSL